MQKKIITHLLASILLLAAGFIASAQSYSNTVKSLNPVAYWPLNEATQPPFGQYIATNRGTAGALANGYYDTWYQALTAGSATTYYQTNNILHVPGAIGDGDTAMSCTHAGAGAGQFVVFPRFTNGIVNPAITLVPPFAIELWVYPTTTLGTVMPIVNEGRNPVIDGSTGYGTNYETGFSLGQFGTIFYFATWNNRGADSTKQELDTALTANTWQHMVINFDGTNQTWFKNGVQISTRAIPASAVNAAGQRYTPDLTSPLLIGTGSIIGAGNGASEFGGNIDEVAIYTNTLDATSIQNHFSAASATDTSYQNAVLANNPVIYVRLDEPAMPASSYPAVNTYPVATNYGAIGAVANGFYQPGTTPGVAGPSYSGFGASSRAVAINGFSGAVDIGGGALPPELNPTNNQPLSIAAWFQGNPTDGAARFQEILGHGNTSWRIAIDNNGGARFNPGNNPELQFASIADIATNGLVVNDNKWHFIAGVSDGTTDSLYIDGVLAKTGTPVGAITGSTLDPVLGGDPGFLMPIWNGNVSSQPRYIDGQIAQVAFFTNALSSAQVQQLYNAAGVPPTIVTQPPVSVTNNSGATVSIPVNARGSATLTYQWYKSPSTLLASQTASNLVFNPATTNNSGSYYAVVANSFGSVTSSVVQLTILGPPTIQQQSLTDIRVFTGTHPVLRVTASGPSLNYQWSRNSSPVAGATNSSYTVTNTSTAGSSTYTCTVSNFVGTATINPITVAVLAAPTAPYPQQVLADAPASYYRLDEGPDNGLGNNGVSAYDYAGGFNCVYSNANLGLPGYNTTTDPSQTAAQFGYFQANDSYAGEAPAYLTYSAPTNNNVQVSVEAWVNSAFSQSTDGGIVTLGYGFGGEQFNLDVGGRNGSLRTFRFYVVDASGSTHSASSLDANVASDGVWHHLVGVCDEAGGKVSLYIDGVLKASGAVNPFSGIRTFTRPLSIGSRLSTSTATDYDNQFQGSIDDVAIYNYALSSNQVAAHYFGAGIPPVITQIQPFTSETNQGATATYTLSVSGSSPLTYQWSDNNGAPIPWGTNATLNLTNVQQSQQGNYSVVVSNPFGTASTNANLIVDLGAPVVVVDLQPTNLTVYTGVPVTYSVTVSGSAPFSYQWFRNGAAVGGATGSSYTFNAIQGTNTYYVAVTNQYSASQVGGPTFSSTGTVIGVPAPTLNPSDYTYKMKISFSGYNRSESLSDFPALVRLGTNLSGFSYSQVASPTGGDLRFTDSGGTRIIPSEIDEWNPGDVSPVWVQVPALSGTNDFIWAYWGNPANTTPPSSQTNGAVWVPQTFENLPSYQVVYHLKESAFPFADSTEQHPATNGVAPVPAQGIVGLAGTFSGAVLDAGTFDLGDQFTLSSWVNITTGITDIQTTWANQTGGFAHNGFALYVDNYQTSDQQLRFASGDGTAGNEVGTAGGAVSFGQWHMLSATIDRPNGALNLYVDGVLLTSATSVVRDFGTANDVVLGTFSGGSFPLHGLIDESRIRTGISSSNWVWASYMTVAQNSTFESYAPIVSSAVTLGIQHSGNNVILTWSQGTLQSAPDVTGAYTNVTSATSPYTVPASGARQFFRVKVR